MSELKKLPKVISDEQERYLLSGCRSIRDKAIIRFMVNTGVRVSELCSIKLSDLDLNNKCITIIGKGNKERIVTLNSEVISALSEYISGKRYQSDYLFSAKGGNRLSRYAVWFMLNNASKNGGLTGKVHPHMLRHTFCTRLTENNVGIERIAELAGHSRLDTTRIYSKVSLNKKHEAVSVLNKRSFLSGLFNRNNETKLKRSLPVSKLKNDCGFLVDIRRDEIKRIDENIRLKIQSVLFAPEGYGKSSILKYFLDRFKENDRSVIYLDSIDTRKDILKLMDELYDKCFFPDYEDIKEFRKILSPLSINEMLGVIKPELSSDCALIIDDITNLTRRMKRVFYALSNLFIVITASEVKHPIVLDKFDVVKLELLNRHRSLLLINSQIDLNELDDRIILEIYDMIYSRSHGFPRAIVELTDKMRKNNYSLNRLAGDSYTNPANQKSIGWLLLLIVFLMVAFVLKFSLNGFAGAGLVYIGVILIRFLLLRKAYKGG